MLSRVAERVYWMVRYLERAEDAARLVGVYGDLLLDLPRSTELGWRDVLAVLGNSVPKPRRRTRRGSPDRELLRYLLADAANPGSLLASVAMARENARTTRDILPMEGWRAVNELYLYSTRHLPKAVSQRHRNEVLSALVAQSQRITGLLAGTVSHGPAYQFHRIARYLERADMTTRVIEVAAGLLLSGREELRAYDNSLWMAVLRSVSGYQMYRQYVRRRVQGPDVIRFLLKDRDFPRSVRYCIGELNNACARLPNRQAPREAAAALAAELTRVRPGQLDEAAVQVLVDLLQRRLAGLHEAVVATWFRPEVAA